jgi:putative chitinase
MFQSSFGEALSRLWPHGDAKIPGLRAGIIAGAPVVFEYGITTQLLAAHVMAQISHECGAGHDVVENKVSAATGQDAPGAIERLVKAVVKKK